MTASVTRLRPTLHRERQCAATEGDHRGVVQWYACGPRCAAHAPKFAGPFGFPRKAGAA